MKLEAKRLRQKKREEREGQPAPKRGRPPKRGKETAPTQPDSKPKVDEGPKAVVTPEPSGKRRRLRPMVMTPQGLKVKPAKVSSSKRKGEQKQPAKAGKQQRADNAEEEKPDPEKQQAAVNAEEETAGPEKQQLAVNAEANTHETENPPAGNAKPPEVENGRNAKRALKAKLALKKLVEHLPPVESKELSLPGLEFTKMSYTAINGATPLTSSKIGVILYTENFYVYEAKVPDFLQLHFKA